MPPPPGPACDGFRCLSEKLVNFFIFYLHFPRELVKLTLILTPAFARPGWSRLAAPPGHFPTGRRAMPRKRRDPGGRMWVSFPLTSGGMPYVPFPSRPVPRRGSTVPVGAAGFGAAAPAPSTEPGGFREL